MLSDDLQAPESSAPARRQEQPGRSIRLTRLLRVRAPNLPTPGQLTLLVEQNRLAGSTPVVNRIVGGARSYLNLLDQEGVGPSRTGAHTVRDHVGKTDHELAAAPKETASTFTDLAVANRAVTGALRANAPAIHAWMHASPGPKPACFDYESRHQGGRTRIADGSIRPATAVRIVLQQDENGNLVVLTAYPQAGAVAAR